MGRQDTRPQKLRDSTDMVPVEGTVDVKIPIDVLWNSFTLANLWPRWNKCFYWELNRSLVKGRQLIWCFQPIRWWFPYKMPAIAKIIEVESEDPKRKVTWAVVALPGFYANHTYHMEDLGDGYTRFGSWEQAYGWSFRVMKFFWVNHFTFVKDRSLEGCRDLEQYYRRYGKIDGSSIPKRSYLGLLLWTVLLIALAVLFATRVIPVSGAIEWLKTNAMFIGIGAGVIAAGLLAIALRFYFRWVRVKAQKLTDGLHVLLDGGGNSVLLEEKNKTLLIDTKFSPASRSVKKWTGHNAACPVTDVINTHHHYDHTFGNVLYPDANIHAFRPVVEFMKSVDAEYWRKHDRALPTELFDGNTAEFQLGSQTLSLTLCRPAHTHADTWVHFRRNGNDYLFVNDLLFNRVFPFFDADRHAGCVISGVLQTIRDLATQFPDAVVIPGHGPVGTTDDLRKYADFLEKLEGDIESAIEANCTEDETVARVNLNGVAREATPSRHITLFPVWSNAKTCVRMAYRVIFDDRARRARQNSNSG